ncbi:MAG: ABC transporter substrate-binding protein, partial [Pseudomonadota bacterium]
MKLKHLLGATALVVPFYAVAAELPACEGCGDEMTIVSWGGAYSASQQNAYHTPYSDATGVTIINDESSPEAVAKLRAMNEAGNVTWDVVDV